MGDYQQPPLTESQAIIIGKLQTIIDLANPCKIKPRRPGEQPYCARSASGYLGHCCYFSGPCQHLGPKGCRVCSVGCKFWFCDTAWNNLGKSEQDAIRKLGHAWKGDIYMYYDRHKLTFKLKYEPPPWGPGLSSW